VQTRGEPQSEGLDTAATTMCEWTTLLELSVDRKPVGPVHGHEEVAVEGFLDGQPGSERCGLG
jgi:hypothetical protein